MLHGSPQSNRISGSSASNIQGMCDGRKMLYESSIVGAQAEKLANFLDTLRSRELSCLGLGFSPLGVSM